MRGYDFDAIRATYPLSEVAGKAVKLRKAGREWQGLCPFHQEKSPSFYVNDEKGFFHCFGCAAHGDVIDFVQRVDHLGTPQEAIARLTGGTSVTLSDDDRRKREAWLAQREQEEAAARVAAIEQARRRWDQARPVDGPQGYLDKKQIAPFNVRVEGDNLLVPMWDQNGDVMNVQSISSDGKRKLYHAGCPTIGGRFYMGMSFGRAIVCEGFATGCSIYEATSDKVAVAFSSGQVGNIARELIAAGVSVIIAADRKALSQMEALGAELGVPVIAPPPLQQGDDFNDQMIEQGVEAVAATFREGMLAYANQPEPPPAPPPCAISFVDAMDFNEADIPLRPWIIPGALLAGSTHILAAPGGTGKSVFTLQMALMLAAGQGWAKWRPKKKCRVLVINAEDDIHEQRRRMVAARTVMGFGADKGMVMLADAPDSILMSTSDPVKKSSVATPLVDELVDIIRHYAIDVVIVDPFAETFDGDENSNGDTKWAMKIWRDKIARPTGAAVYLVHHTTKGSEDKAGSADVIRGGGAIVNSARLAATLFVMSKAEASALSVKEDDRFRYVRYDDAKSNNSLIGGRTWFEKISVILQNGVGDDGGDEVGALKPWQPDGLAAYQPEAIMRLLEAMEAGYVDEDGVATDMPFGRSKANRSKRWVGHLIADMMGLEESEIAGFIGHLGEAGAISDCEFHDSIHGRQAKGLEVNMEAARAALGLSPLSE